jgi:hypothetical protein
VKQTRSQEVATMDEHRFDAWTHSLAHRLPRRGALGVLAALGLLRASTRSATAAMVQTPECEEGATSTCPTGSYCRMGECETCLSHGEAGCEFNSDCCGAADLVCNESLRCVFCEWTGTWSTNWGDMRLRQTGMSVSGDYDHDQGMISGSVSGNVLSATWMEVPSRKPPSDAGDLAFTMAADCQSFTGTWRYGMSGDMSAGWSGERIGASGDTKECDKKAKACVASVVAYCNGRYTGEESGLCIGLHSDCCANYAQCHDVAGDACLRNSPY